jgi:hypothetical protein
MRSYLLAALVVLMSAQAAPPEIVALTSIPSPPPVFEQSPLTPAQSTRISEKAWHPGCPADLSELRTLTVTYWDFHAEPRTGILVVNREVAADLLYLFRQLFDHGFLIQSIRPIEEFSADDETSMEANNTSAFNCRDITGKPGTFSNHSWGRAIDINPLTNPMILNGHPLPPQGASYADRGQAWPGSILDGSFIVNLFRSHGWTWGGEWKNPDYQHFEKPGH